MSQNYTSPGILIKKQQKQRLYYKCTDIQKQGNSGKEGRESDILYILSVTSTFPHLWK